MEDLAGLKKKKKISSKNDFGFGYKLWDVLLRHLSEMSHSKVTNLVKINLRSPKSVLQRGARSSNSSFEIYS